jgi:hypothetical protein
MDGQKAVCPHNEIFFSNKKKWNQEWGAHL